MLCSNKPSTSSVTIHSVKDMGMRGFACFNFSRPCTWSFKIIYLETFFRDVMSVCLSVISKCTETFGLEMFYVAGVLMCVEERCHCAVVCFEKLPELWRPDESD